MSKLDFLTDASINERLGNTLDMSLLLDDAYQALVCARDNAADMLHALDLTSIQWRVIDDYRDALNSCSAFYATAAYRLGFSDGVDCTCPSADTDVYVAAADKILDALENGSVPITWHTLVRSRLSREIAAVLADLAKKR